MKIFSIIVHFNSPSEVISLVQQLRACDMPDHQIVVADNASDPVNLEALKTEVSGCSNVTLIELNKNGGFGAGVNRAVEYISSLKNNADILVINSDVEVVNSQFIREMTNYLKAHPEVAMVGPKVIEKGSGNTQNTILPITSISSVLQFRQQYSRQNRSEVATGPIYVNCLNGVCFLIRLHVFVEIGGFDEEYFMYNEEQDLCLKIRKAGYKLCFLPVASIAHAGAYSDQSEKIDWRFLYKRRNIVLFLRKHRGVHEALPIAFLFSLSSISKFIGRPGELSWSKFVSELFRVVR